VSLLVPLAFRNLFRNVRRTVITSVAVVFGVALQILGWGLADGLDENYLRAGRTTATGDVVLRPDGYPIDGIDFPLEDTRPLSSEVTAKLDAAGAWTARTFFFARVVHGSDADRAQFVAWDAATETRVFTRENWALEGEWPKPGEDRLVLGARFARLMNLKLGDEVVVEARTAGGAMNALTFRVAGLLICDNAALDNLGAWIELEAAERLLQLEGRRSHVSLLSDDPDATAAALRGLGWNVRTNAEESAELLALNVIRRRAVMILVFVIMAIAATGIANTVIMAAYERVREIGTLMALGMRRTAVAQLFLLEGAVMGLAAGSLGAIIGSLAVRHWQHTGINLGDEIMKASGNLAVSAHVYMLFRWPPVGFALAFGVLVALAASVIPARFASRLVPADAVRAE
jgi:putative ABC transport system permease protein